MHKSVAHIVATGLEPPEIDALSRAAAGRTTQSVSESPPEGVLVDLLVVGDVSPDPAVIARALLNGHSQTRVLPFEGALVLLTGQADWWRTRKAMIQACATHEGLRLAQYMTLALRTKVAWPVPERFDRARVDLDALNKVSLLGAVGLTYALEQPEEKRHHVLDEAVRRLGLEYVVNWLRFRLVMSRALVRRGKGGPATLAILERDFAWLKATYPGTEVIWPT